MDILLDLLFSFVFELLPSLFLEEKGRRPRAPEEQEAMTTGADIESGDKL
jgi:hypothetical protein